jgi:hypothetical protein
MPPPSGVGNIKRRKNMEEKMECFDTDKVKPLDELLDDTIKEFDSGSDTECDKDLDKMIWDLGDFENEEPPQEAEEFQDEVPVEEELMEKTMIVGHNGRASFRESSRAKEDISAGVKVAAASSIGPEPGRTRNKAARGRISSKKKK